MRKQFFTLFFLAAGAVGFSQTQTLVHYWHFNNLASGPMDTVVVDYTLLPDSAIITYPGTGDGFMDRNAGDGSLDNARNGEPAGNSLRARNPSDTRDLLIALPTTGFENPTFSYEVYRSNNGQLQNLLYYTVDGTSYVFLDTVEVTTTYATHTYNFTAISAANDNPNFGIKIAFEGQHTGTSGNNRMDNFTLEADPMVPIATQEVTFQVLDANGPVIGADVLLAGITQTTNVIGNTVFTVPQGATTYSVTRSGYAAVTAVPVTISADTTIQVTLQPLAQNVLHYWHFNDLQLVNGAVDSIVTDYSISGLANGLLYYAGVSSGYMDDFSPGSPLNTQLMFPAGDALRVRNRAEGRSLILELPTTDCEDLLFAFDVHRSGSGMLENFIEYTTDGITYTAAGLSNNVIAITESFTTEIVDFSQITAANNNPNFAIRITYNGNSEQENGNNRYDNIALLGTATNGLSAAAPKKSVAVSVYPNPAADHLMVHIPENTVGATTATIVSIQGTTVSRLSLKPGENKLALQALSSGVYMLLVEGEQGVSTTRFVKQ